MATIVMVYHHEERGRTDRLVQLLEQAGYDVLLAPMGYEVGSAEWQAKVKTDLKAADAVVVIMTTKAANDPWFDFRFDLARELGKRIFPVQLDKPEPPPDRLEVTYQTLNVSDADTPERAYEMLLSALSKVTPSISCFISYARENTDFAARLAADLREKNVKVWRDADSIPAGSSWDFEIQNALSKCTHLLLVATPASVVSPNVADEISFALNKGKTIIPLIAETCDLPLRIHRAQWVDFRASYEQPFSELLRHLGLP